MASIQSFNIRKAVEETLHFPRTKGETTYPLYRRVDNYDSNSDGASSQLYAVPGAMELMQNRYNSPNNVKRLFIFRNFICVETFTGAIISSDGKRGARINRRHLADNLVNSQLMGVQRGENTYVGNVIEAIMKPNMCSNIEEIYIDSSALHTNMYTLMLSNPMESRIADIFRNGVEKTGYNISEARYNCLGTNIIINKEEFPLEVLAHGVSLNKLSVGDKFSRLHSIAIMDYMGISDADKIESVILNTKDKPAIFGIKEAVEGGSPLIIGNPQVIMCFNPVIFKNNAKQPLTTREGIYEFDRVVLAQLNKSMQQEARQQEIAKKEAVENKEEAGKTEIKESKSEIEIELDKIYDNNRSLANMQSILYLVCSGKSKEEVEQMFSEMSEAGRKKYKALIFKN